MLSRMPPTPLSRRSSGRPLDVAASLALTVGLLGCAAPIAKAADATPTTVGADPAPTALGQSAPPASTTGKPPWKGTFDVFFPSAPVAVGTKITVKAHLVNTGTVPLKVTIDPLPQPGGAPVDIAPGERKTFVGESTVTAEELRTGTWALDISVRSVSPDGSVDVTTSNLRKPFPAVAPTTPPSQPATPAPAPTQPATPVPTSAPSVEHPALERTVTATFKPGEPYADGSESPFVIDFTIHLKNTGDVPLNVFLDNWQRGTPITLAAGESKDVGPARTYVTPSDVADDSWRYTTTGSAYTPKGARIDADVDTVIPVPKSLLPVPTPAPSQPATPSPSQPATPTPGPSPAPASTDPAVTVTITGKFLTEPGELVKEGTRVQFTYDVKNTGGVDLKDVLGRKTFKVGESFLLNTTEAVVSAQNLKDGFVPAEAKLVRGTLPDGSRVTVSAPFVYKLPIPEKPPIPVPAPDLDVKIAGTFQVKEGEPVVAGTKVTWVAQLTNTGNVALRDLQVADSEKLAELPVGETGVVSFETEVTERDVFNHSIWVASLATATTPEGTTFTKSTLGTLGIPTVTPTPAPTPPPTPTPGPTTGPTATPTAGPTPVGPDVPPSGGAVAPAAEAASRAGKEIAVPTAPAAAAASSKQSNANHLASTGSDAAAVLPVAGVLGLLGAIGVLLGRRRRRNGTATE
ncbi:LPXTG cell wall anchor domain-containing protein [Rathayibacter festucae]|uniref:LPXTG cell wall anchor domain-containing protein n=1 Tax=Rathayibacter festucae TaxID=110937 RepID=A0ABX6GZC2_9MICO|nr:LPXTG cell wall anchor domain-containing protein [Rathayibacter festucae]QHC62889.1 LPXTG cell wall anchor domain-containing protein [Rathayibacter festucae]